jgi:hypothetical protein
MLARGNLLLLIKVLEILKCLLEYWAQYLLPSYLAENLRKRSHSNSVHFFENSARDTPYFTHKDNLTRTEDYEVANIF